jgi:hypothetical protein
VVTGRYITFEDGGQGRVTSKEMIKVSEFVTFKYVALAKPLGSFSLLSLSHVWKVSFVCSLTLMPEFRGSMCA